MKAKLLSLVMAVGLLAACSSNEDTSSTSAAGGAGDGTGGSGGISSTGLGGGGSATPGSQGELETVVGDTVFFAYDSSTIDGSARGTLDRQAEWLIRFPSVQVMVAGHADERGTREYNLALGERRAAAVKAYLVALGVPGTRILTISYGEERPLDPAPTEAAFAQNRRAQTSVSATN